MDQGRQGGGETDAAELSPVPGERGVAVAERVIAYNLGSLWPRSLQLSGLAEVGEG